MTKKNLTHPVVKNTLESFKQNFYFSSSRCLIRSGGGRLKHSPGLGQTQTIFYDLQCFFLVFLNDYLLQSFCFVKNRTLCSLEISCTVPLIEVYCFRSRCWIGQNILTDLKLQLQAGWRRVLQTSIR